MKAINEAREWYANRGKFIHEGMFDSLYVDYLSDLYEKAYNELEKVLKIKQKQNEEIKEYWRER